MVAKGNFDDIIKQESAGFRSSRNQDSGENARDRAARRLNVKSGKNPNPRTSTAYKPDKAAAAKSKPKQKSKPDGGRGPPRSAPQQFQQTPQQGPIPPGKTEALPSVDPGNPLMFLPFLIAAMGARRNAGDPNSPRVPGPPEGAVPEQFDPYAKQLAPPAPVPLARVPNGPDEMPMLPAPSNAGALPPPQRMIAGPEGGGLEEQIGRFLSESEIGGMQKAMPGVIKSPGWGPTKLPRGMRP